jgi:GxxExxY protein
LVPADFADNTDFNISDYMDENELSYKIRGAIFKVYNELGPGLLESVYEAALCYQLRKEDLKVDNQVKVNVVFDGQILPVDYRIDILVDDKVIIELKSVETLLPVHHKQLLTYLKLTKKKLGLLVNFNSDDITKSIIRKVNGL